MVENKRFINIDGSGLENTDNSKLSSIIGLAANLYNRYKENKTNDAPSSDGTGTVEIQTPKESVPIFEGIGQGLKSGTAGTLNIPFEFSDNLDKLSNPEDFINGQRQTNPLDPIPKFQEYLKGAQESDHFIKNNFGKDENIPSLVGDFVKSGHPIDLERLAGFTAHNVAQVIPTFLAAQAASMTGIPAALIGAAFGASTGLQAYNDNPDMTDGKRAGYAATTGAINALGSGASVGLAKAGMAGKASFEQIPYIGKAIAKATQPIFSGLAKTIGVAGAHKIVRSALVSSLGQGSDMAAMSIASMMADEHFKGDLYSFKQYLDTAIEQFGVNAIASLVVGAPMAAAYNLQMQQQTGKFPTINELFARSYIPKILKNGFPGSQNPENQPHILDGDVVILESKADEMLGKKEFVIEDDAQQGFFELLGAHLKEQLANPERGSISFRDLPEKNTKKSLNYRTSFSNTEDAFSYGESIRGNAEAINALNVKEKILTGEIAKAKELKQLQKGLDLSVERQKIHEALEKATTKEKIDTPFLNAPEEVKRNYNSNELTRAIGEVNREQIEILESEIQSAKDIGDGISGGEINSYEKERGEKGYYRQALPSYLKHPKTGNKPINQKQWRELAQRNLAYGNTASGMHEEYNSLNEQKRIFIEKLAEIEMQSSQIAIKSKEQSVKTSPKAFEEMTKDDREWFNLNMQQGEIFDDIPPADYDANKRLFGDINPYDLKDISGVAMNLRDSYQNSEHVFGNNFHKIEKTIHEPLDRAVNDFVNMKKDLTLEMKREIIEKLGIKKKSKLSAAVQILGEGKYNNDDGRYYKITEQELIDMVGKENVSKVREAEKWFRNKYNQLISDVNKVRSEIYPGNSSKLVPFRQNYFRHFHEMTEMSGLKNMFDTPANIPSELAGVSQFTQPKSKFAGFMMRRFGALTEIDAVGGFLDYVPAAAQAIHVDKMIPKIRALEKYLRVITHDSKNLNNYIEFLMNYANQLAGKTNLWDRGTQQILGRNNMRVLDFVTNLAKKNSILFNLSSALVQGSNIPMGVAKTKFYFPTGTGDYLKSVITGSGEHLKSAFLNTRYGQGVLDIVNNSIMSKPESSAKWMMTALDYVSTHMIWYAFHSKAIGQKIDNPIRYADVETRKVVAGRAIHEVPLMQKAKVFQALSPFTLEIQNMWWNVGSLGKEKQFVGLAIFALVSWIMNNGFESILGRRVIFDPIDAMNEAFRRDKEGNRKTVAQSIGRLVGEVTSNMVGGNYIQSWYPEYGFTWAGGYKMPTRYQIFGANDRTRFGSGILAVEWIKGLPYSALPTGGVGQIKKTIGAMKELNQGYSTVNGKDIRIKKTPATVAKALAFGKSAIPEVRKYYKDQSNKVAKQPKESGSVAVHQFRLDKREVDEAYDAFNKAEKFNDVKQGLSVMEKNPGILLNNDLKKRLNKLDHEIDNLDVLSEKMKLGKDPEWFKKKSIKSYKKTQDDIAKIGMDIVAKARGKNV